MQHKCCIVYISLALKSCCCMNHMWVTHWRNAVENTFCKFTCMYDEGPGSEKYSTFSSVVGSWWLMHGEWLLHSCSSCHLMTLHKCTLSCVHQWEWWPVVRIYYTQLKSSNWFTECTMWSIFKQCLRLDCHILKISGLKSICFGMLLCSFLFLGTQLHVCCLHPLPHSLHSPFHCTYYMSYELRHKTAPLWCENISYSR